MAFAILVAVLVGCATPATVPVDSTRVAGSSQTETLEQIYRQRATALAGDRRWADAAVQWELLTLLRPDSKDYRNEAERARLRAADAAATHVRVAEEARKRGSTEQATLSFLRALGADPGNVTAVNGLKVIEAERVRRAWLERPPRVSYDPPNNGSQSSQSDASALRR